MRSAKQTFFIICGYVAIDIVCILLSFYLVLLFRPQTLPFNVSLEGFFSSSNPFKILFFSWTPFILFFYQMHGLYHTRRERFEGLEIVDVIKSVILSSLIIIVMAYLLRIHDFPRSVMFLSAAAIAFFCSLWRVLKKVFVNFLAQNGYNNFNVVIIGAGKVGILLAEEIKKRPALGINIVGFLDDFKTGACGSGNWPVLGRIDELEAVSKKYFLNKIFITIYHNSEVFVKMLEQARECSLAVRVVPQGYEWMGQDPQRYNIGIIPILAYWDIEVNYRLRTKRLFDLCLALIILVPVLPLLGIIALYIKLDSKGPILYSSQRYGARGRIFNMYKFRSMICNAHDMLAELKNKNEMDGPIFKIRKDPRVTRAGAFLRKYSLDELPQIINVIKGDMSLVGPRPLPIDQIEKEDLQQLKRLEVRPGITGLWQVRGRSDLSFARLVKWDVWYINNWSFGLDLYILMQTIPVVLKGKGAY